MLDIRDLLDCAQDDCVFDIYDCNEEKNIAESLDRHELEDWLDHHNYDLCSFEPIQRKDQTGSVVYGLVWNVENVEEE